MIGGQQIPTKRSGRSRLGLFVALLSAGLALVLAGVALGGAFAPEPVKRDALARTDKVKGAKDRDLVLSKVAVKPGAELALHHHEGTQIARIAKGTLTYTVVDGKAKVHKGDADTDPKLVRTIKAGETAKIKTGQWIVEQPSNHHMAANNGKEKVVIYLATLLKHGAAPSTPG